MNVVSLRKKGAEAGEPVYEAVGGVRTSSAAHLAAES